MSNLSDGVRLGAAVFVAGLALASPQALGVAAADSGRGDGRSAEASDGAERRPSARASRVSRSPVPLPAAGEAAIAPPQAARGEPTAGVPVRAASRPTSRNRARTGSADVPAPDSPASARGAAPVVVDRAPVVPPSASVDAAGSPTAPPPPAVAIAASTPASPAPTPAAAFVGTVGRCSNCWVHGPLSSAFPVPPKVEQRLTSLAYSVERLIDTVGNWLSGLPASPVTEFLSGALWLVRRTAFPVGTGVGLWGSVACVNTKDCSGQDLTGADLSRQDLSAVDFSSATLARANLSGATLNTTDLTKADLGQANLAEAQLIRADLTGADLSGADLSRAVMAYSVTTGTIWNDTTCPNGSKSSTGCGGSPGLIASDSLRVDEETGEWDGDEPVLMSVVLQTTLGTTKSTNVAVIPNQPRQLGQGVDEGTTIGIPDNTGDLWLNSVKPLSYADFAAAAESGKPLPIPVIVTVGLAYEGDGSTAAGARLTADLLADYLRGDIATALEGTKLYAGGPIKAVGVTDPGKGYTSATEVKISAPEFGRTAVLEPVVACVNESCGVLSIKVVDGGTGYLASKPPTVTISDGGGGTGAKAAVELDPKADVVAVMKDAIATLKEAAIPDRETILKVVMSRIEQWYSAVGDPDDPVGVSVTALIPVDDTMLTALDLAFTDRGGFAAAVGLDDQFLGLRTESVGVGPVTVDAKLYKVTADFRSRVQIRYGLLVPPEALKKNEGKTDKSPQSWETTYNGIWSVTGASNDWAKYVVETKAWPQITWRP